MWDVDIGDMKPFRLKVEAKKCRYLTKEGVSWVEEDLSFEVPCLVTRRR